MTQIRVENLTAYYEKNAVFENLNFTVEQGDYLVILGENGSGKTTLMRYLLGLGIRFTGKISYNGFSRRQIGWLPQRTETQKDFPADVSEVVLSGFSGKGTLGIRYRKESRKQAAAYLKALGLSDLKNRSFRELSGGQQQRVLLCRALCAADRVLLLDEPVAGLDAPSQNELYETIRQLHRQGMTILMISHEIDRALQDATRVLHLGKEDFFFGSSEEYRESDFQSRTKEEGS
ncbi:MAG: metal ABC transporter ATP-binding protein [Clostridia bacterium]|nr:metal ABC transporter ATP-binding protein [Clostridia bacterium]